MNKFLIYVVIHLMSMNLATEFPATRKLAASQALSHWELLTAGRLSSLRVKSYTNIFETELNNN